MHRRSEPHGLRARLSNPLLALLIAAVAAVGAIAQCGLMLDAAVVGVAGPGASGGATAGAGRAPAGRPQVAAAPHAVQPADSPRAN